MPKLSEALFGKSAKTKKLSTLSPEQTELMTLIKEGLTKGEGAFGELFGKFKPEEFEKGVTQPALKNFRENVLPMLQEKFVSRGDVGGSGMQRAQGRAATDFQSQLAKLMYEAQQGQKANQISGINTAVGRQSVENLHQPATQGMVHGFVKGVGEGLGQAGGAAIGGMPMPKFSGAAGGAGGGVSAAGYDQEFRTNPAAMGY